MFEEMKIRHLLWISVLFTIIGIILFVIFPLNENFINIFTNLIMYVFVPLVFFGYYFKRVPRSVRDVVYTKGVKGWIPSLFGIVAVCIAFSLGTFWLTVFVLNPIAPSIVEFIMTAEPMHSSVWILTFEIVIITIVGPIVEEFIFRGVILHRLMRKTSMWGGILISSILFGFLHADMIGAFFFGVIASLLFLKTGNLLIPILMHMINNTIAVLLMFVEPALPNWLFITDAAHIETSAIPNIVMLITSTLLTGFIVYKLGRLKGPTANIIKGGDLDGLRRNDVERGSN